MIVKATTGTNGRVAPREPTRKRLAHFVRDWVHREHLPMSWSLRVWLLAAGHLALFFFIYQLAFGIRFDFAIPAVSEEILLASVPWVMAAKFVMFYVSGHYHGWLTHVTFSDLIALIRASLLSLFAIATTDHFLHSFQIPRGILILDCILGIVFLGALRSCFRLFHEGSLPFFQSRGDRVTLLVGADHSTGRLARVIRSHRELPFRIRGFLALNGEKKGTRLGGTPILGAVEMVREIAQRVSAMEVLAIAGSMTGPKMRELMQNCNQGGLNLKIIPQAEDLFDGDHRIPIRDIDINDLLRREPVNQDKQAIGELLAGRRVLVTGAGGSIGSEICRQILAFAPESLILVGRGENRVFEIDRELRSLDRPVFLASRIGDVTDDKRMRQIFEEFQPEVVFHAAAHKHVPLMENNVGEAIKNNVIGTRCVAELADEMGVQCFVLISSDKAVQPTSVMGASKHLAERFIHTMSQESNTRFIVTRFGNVLGSAGSVVPIFQRQIRQGGPITITDPRMTRFFMTIPEASQLVLQAAAMGAGGEIFVLDMGRPVKIVDLARDLIRLSGLPENAIEFSYVGIRPGEKLYEELYFDDEMTLETSHSKLRAAYHRPYNLVHVHQQIAELEQLVNMPNETILQKLFEIIDAPHAEQQLAHVTNAPAAPGEQD